jgi:hypothetical protein
MAIACYQDTHVQIIGEQSQSVKRPFNLKKSKRDAPSDAQLVYHHPLIDGVIYQNSAARGCPPHLKFDMAVDSG